jgi:hypothetical protein
MSEIAAAETRRISGCRIVHLTVRVLFVANVLILAAMFPARLSHLFMSWYLATSLIQASVVSTFLLPFVAILEGVIIHHRKKEGRRGAILDVVITSSWAVGFSIWVFYGLTHAVVL